MSNTYQLKRIYRPDIDGLRAIAIVSVIAYHAGIPGASGGFVGVDVFFVISGFLITALLFNEAAVSGRINLGAFYARRVRRLMPAGLLVVAVTLLLGAFFFPPASEEQRSLARSAIAFSYFSSNFYFFKATGGYFDAPSFSWPLLHTWSLAVEEQYYLIWPLIMLLVFRLAKPLRTESVMRVRSAWVLGVMLVASLILCISITHDHQNFAFFLLPARVWEFAIGGIVGLATTSCHAKLRRWGDGLALGGLVLIVYSVVTFEHGIPFPGSAAVLPVFGTAALIIGMSADEGGWVRRLLAARALVFIGLLSYSWYLWHWPLLSIYRIYNLGAQDVVANAVIVLIALLLAWLTYVWVENPIRVQRPGPFRSVRPTLLVGLCIVLTTLAMGNSLKWWRQYQKDSGLYGPIASGVVDYSPYWERCLLGVSRQFGELPLEECMHGPDKKHPKVLLWGDSHADHVMAMLMEAFPDIAVYQLTMAGCPPVVGYELQVPTITGNKVCPDFNLRVIREITELKKRGLEGVVISARWAMYLRHPSIAISEQQLNALSDPEELARARVEMQARFDETLSMLDRAGVRVLVLAPSPEMIYPPRQCISLRRGSYCDVPRAINEKFLSDASLALEEVVNRHPNVKLAQLMDFFCDEQHCFAERDGKILAFDEHHITATAARGLGHFLSAHLNWLLGEAAVAKSVSQH
jgi:peptidoglycan/LPS O-acetylase OafA/YrhL